MSTRIQVVYESQFGNVERLAEAIAAEFGVAARALWEGGPEVDTGTDVVILGAPTHMFTLSTALSRSLARSSGGRGGPGMREWLATAALERAGAVAVFGTQSSRFSGSATRAAVRRARGRGSTVIGSAEFLVTAQAGPLAAGELDRARDWARAIRQQIAGAS